MRAHIWVHTYESTEESTHRRAHRWEHRGGKLIPHRAQAKRTWIFHKSHFAWKLTGKMPDPRWTPPLNTGPFTLTVRTPSCGHTVWGTIWHHDPWNKILVFLHLEIVTFNIWTHEMKALVFWRPTSPTASQYVEHVKNIGILSFSKTYLPRHFMNIIDIVESSL